MASFLKSLFAGLVSIVVIVPATLLLLTFGFPLLLIAVVIGVPLIAILFMAGLPILAVGVVLMLLVAVPLGLLGPLFGLGFALFKILLFVVLPITFIVWLFSKIFSRD
jgi:hypothetical protein